MEVYLVKQWMALLGYSYKATDENLKLLCLKKKIFVTPSGTHLRYKLIQSTLEISQSMWKLIHVLNGSFATEVLF